MSSFYTILPYKYSDEYNMYEVDAVWHPALYRVARRRLAHRLRTRFFHLAATKRHTLIVQTLAALGHRDVRGAWAVVIEASGEVLWVLRNTARSLQDPKDRTICRICLEDIFAVDAKTNVSVGVTECLILGAVFMLGALTAFAICPFLGRPTFPTCLQSAPPPFVWFL
jgi:hypothetical protein